jgi:hypothetical protein
LAEKLRRLRALVDAASMDVEAAVDPGGLFFCAARRLTRSRAAG